MYQVFKESNYTHSIVKRSIMNYLYKRDIVITLDQIEIKYIKISNPLLINLKIITNTEIYKNIQVNLQQIHTKLFKLIFINEINKFENSFFDESILFEIDSVFLIDQEKSNYWDFSVYENNNLFSIKKGPVTKSNKSELFILNESNFKEFLFMKPLIVNISYQAWSFLVLNNGDLFGIKRGSKTGSGFSEIHVLDKSTDYKSFSTHIKTPIPLHNNWTFLLTKNENLFCIKEYPNKISKKLEIHILSKKSNYKSFSFHSVTPIPVNEENIWDFCLDSSENLLCIKKGNATNSNKTEIHILSKKSKYKNFSYHCITKLPLTNNNWQFNINGSDDLVCILKAVNSKSKKMEIHILSKESKYKEFSHHSKSNINLITL